MKKWIIIAVIIIIILVLAFFFLRPQKTVAPNGMMQAENKPIETEKSGGGLLNEAAKIKEALLGGQKMECTYSFKEEDSSTPSNMKVWLDGKKFRSSYEMEGKKYVNVSDGKAMYSWMEGDTKGTMIAFDCMEEATKDLPQTEQNKFDKKSYESTDDIIDNSMNMNCQKVGSIDLEVPKNITFDDTCAMMKQSLEMMKNFKMPEIPAGQ